MDPKYLLQDDLSMEYTELIKPRIAIDPESVADIGNLESKTETEFLNL